MTTLLCLGFGYSARHYVVAHGERYAHVVGTTRSEENAGALAASTFGEHRVRMIVFDGTSASPALLEAVSQANVLLVSIAPDDGNDPTLALLRNVVAAAPELTAIVYLSTIAVYGNHDGGWIDEDTPLTPALTRAQDRIEAERAWQALGEARGVPVAVIRIAGIYGPGQNALEAVKSGRARRIAKPGQVFNRIHVGDLADIIDAAVRLASTRGAGGIFNAADDEPTAPGDPITFAASLLNLAPPPEIPFEEARKTMSPFAVSFYGESKRVRNVRVKSVLGVTLRYPTYREGLRALMASGPNPRESERS
ncbi:MAG: NAD-dependent epimerase/dehydratase family protein [Xanthobacteraceae bacterium]|nr:NAD-dependent epimerase/dehydratase family protein [Xanthobacteraceae bacterium]